ncbi:MAG: hypothetical protein DRN13_02070 [Thermoplasmata archaeon]|nr:MAG: hypothetical protein DRN13_02070 [Thermoplasmata archaeon]
MERNLTDKTYILCLDNNEKIYLTDEQAKQCRAALLSGKEFILMEENLLKTKAIKYILPAREVERAERIKRGEWMCEYGFWHQKGEQCGHGLLKRLKSPDQSEA